MWNVGNIQMIHNNNKKKMIRGKCFWCPAVFISFSLEGVW